LRLLTSFAGATLGGKLTIGDRIRPLDLTHQLLRQWLDHRRSRWPNTANPHLLINQQTATETGPVSTFRAKTSLRRHIATLERLRRDRQLDEALTHDGDPLHLAAVFGLDDKTAIRYVNAADRSSNRRRATRLRQSPGPQRLKNHTIDGCAASTWQASRRDKAVPHAERLV
jgi:hypothetical protein